MVDVADIELLATGASGSAGDVVASHNQHGPYTRARTVPLNPDTPLQQVVRAAVATLTARWRDVLTTDQRRSWNVYGHEVLLLDRIGRKTSVGGLAMYVRSNVSRIQANEPSLQVVDQAPTLFNLAPFTPPTRVVLNVIDDTFYAFTVFPDDWAWTDNSAMLFYVSAPRPLTVNFWKGPYRYAGCILSKSIEVFNPPTIFPLPFPAGTSERVFVRVRVTRGDGRLTSSLRLPVDYLPQIPPVPLYAYAHMTPFRHVDVTFDRLLTYASIDPLNWSARWLNYRLLVSGITIVNDLVRFTFNRGIFDPGLNVVSYAPPPFDVLARYTSVPTAAFLNFPLY